MDVVFKDQDGNQTRQTTKLTDWFQPFDPANPPRAIAEISGRLHLYEGHGRYDVLYLYEGQNTEGQHVYRTQPLA